MRTLVPEAHLLGLTATPTHMDPAIRGWLGRIFEQGVTYEADKKRLTVQGILARPSYIPRPTGKELVVDDGLFNRLVRDHKDLPEDIIEVLASDSRRNDAIVAEYVAHRAEYGKTIIFADRWFQCVYLKTKPREHGVRADAVYYHVEADPGSTAARNSRAVDENDRILREFKHGDGLDVLVNVRMLTEGTDVPSVRTVFLTRQTTSRILLTQMVGRALRGPLAGGGPVANIVMFMDDWKRAIDWATPMELTGGTEEARLVRGYYPLEWVAIHLVEKLSEHINNPDVSLPPFSRLLPVGWYQTELVVAEAEGEDMQSFTEFVMVYEHTQAKYRRFVADLLKNPPSGWDREVIDSDWMGPQVDEWITQYFDPETDDAGGCLRTDIVRLARHIGQQMTPPAYFSFEERDAHNLDRLAESVLAKTRIEGDEYLRAEYDRADRLWSTFFATYERFAMAVDAAAQRQLYERRFGARPALQGLRIRLRRHRELSEAEKEQVRVRDGRACLCCGAKGRGVRLQIDHIVPYNMGGETTVENSQTLCSVCNREKRINEINFRRTSSPLKAPKEDLSPELCQGNPVWSLTRMINFFYHCRAVCSIRSNTRSSGRFYSVWEIELYAGNDPRWLEKKKDVLLKYIHEQLDCPHVKGLRIVGGSRL